MVFTLLFVLLDLTQRENVNKEEHVNFKLMPNHLPLFKKLS